MKIKKLFLIFTACYLGACNLFKSIEYQDVSFLYNFSLTAKSPKYFAFNNSDSTTAIYFKVNSSNLFYNKIDNSDKFFYSFKIKTELFRPALPNKLISSFENVFKDTININSDKEITFAFQIPLKTGDYLAKMVFFNFGESDSIVSYLRLYKESIDNVQNFLVLDNDSNPLINNIIPNKAEIILFSRYTNVKRLYVSVFYDDFPAATTPFSTKKDKPIELKVDTNFFVEFNAGLSSKFLINRKGIYYFRIDSLDGEGLTLFNFGAGFPKITSTEQMLLPLKYISSQKEFNEMLHSEDKKAAIDAFWLKIAGNEDNAKKLIQKYYNLVQEANYYFSSYQEGWKTDRGIIYIVYGPPNIVYKTNRSETWIYGAANSRLSSKFYFYKVENPFTDNDYSLNKSESYKDSWYMALSKWRKI